MRGLFITGTDTGVGKSVLAAAIVAALSAQGLPVKPLKPVITGMDDPPDPLWPPDHELLARAGGCDPDTVAFERFGPPVSPHLAGALARRPLVPELLRERILAAVAEDEIAVVEGVGGLLVPLADGYDVAALAAELGLPLVIAARPGLGTINHTLLTLEAARRRGLAVAAVVMTPWPAQPDTIALSNRETIARDGAVEVAGLAEIAQPDRAALAAAGAPLPVERWLRTERPLR